MSQQRTHAIMASMPTIHAETQTSERQRHVIEYHENLFRFPSEKPGEGANGPATFIHESLRLHQHEIADLTNAGLPFRYRLKRSLGPFSKNIEHPKAHIVTGLEILLSRISSSTILSC